MIDVKRFLKGNKGVSLIIFFALVFVIVAPTPDSVDEGILAVVLVGIVLSWAHRNISRRREKGGRYGNHR